MRKRKKIFGILLLILAVLVMQIPVSEADAAASASDFQMEGSTLVKYNGTSQNVTIPSTVETIGKSAFEGNTTLQKVTIPDSVREIKENAFWGCNQLESVWLGSGLTAIGDYSFANCKGIKTMTIPQNIKTIGIRSFADCVNMTDITIPPEVTEIHETAFDGCAKLMIHAQQGSAADKFAETFVSKQAEMPEYEDVEDYYPQEDNKRDTVSDVQEDSGDTSQTQPGTNGLLSVDSKAGGDEDPGENGYGNSADNKTAQTSGSGDVLLGFTQVVGNRAVVFIDNINPDANQKNETSGSQESADFAVNGDNGQEMEENQTGSGYEPPVKIEKGGALPKFTVVDQTTVADQAYYRNKELTQIHLPESIVQIGQFSFARSALTQIALPEGVQSIGYGAFYHCDSLNEVSLPESVMKVEPKAFEHSAWVERFLKDGSGGSGDYLISGGVLAAYRGNAEKPVLPEGIRVIAAEVFDGHGEIRSVTLPDSLQIIGEAAFSGCENLTEVMGGSYVTEILDRAFSGCPIDTIRIADTVEKIGLDAFDYGLSQKEDITKTAVFHGKNLPEVSVETSSGRLSNENYRKPSLNEVIFAVVDQEITAEELKGTVLNSSIMPFQGIICSIGQDNKLHCRYTNLTEDKAAALNIPEKAYIYGNYYEVTDRDKIVSLAEDMVTPLPGQVQIMGTVGGAGAVLEGAKKGYVLRIEEMVEKQSVERAYQRIYHDSLPGGTMVYDMTLTEGDTLVPITKLGKQNITITIPVPDTLQNQDIQILTLDQNGQLERVSGEIAETEAGMMIRFTTNHFSPYAFYGKGTMYAEAQVTEGKAYVEGFGRKDDSPDTGDYIHPKWFLGIGLMAASLALLVSGNKKSRSKVL